MWVRYYEDAMLAYDSLGEQATQDSHLFYFFKFWEIFPAAQPSHDFANRWSEVTMTTACNLPTSSIELHLKENCFR